MIQLLYTSSATRDMSDADLRSLLRESRANNRKLEITGLLIYKQGVFLQVLEGENRHIDNLYRSICRDKRNTGNYLVERKRIKERNFPSWSMAFRRLEEIRDEDIEGYTDILDKNFTPEEIAKHKDTAVGLIQYFCNTRLISATALENSTT